MQRLWYTQCLSSSWSVHEISYSEKDCQLQFHGTWVKDTFNWGFILKIFREVIYLLPNVLLFYARIQFFFTLPRKQVLRMLNIIEWMKRLVLKISIKFNCQREKYYPWKKNLKKISKIHSFIHKNFSFILREKTTNYKSFSFPILGKYDQYFFLIRKYDQYLRIYFFCLTVPRYRLPDSLVLYVCVTVWSMFEGVFKCYLFIYTIRYWARHVCFNKQQLSMW